MTTPVSAAGQPARRIAQQILDFLAEIPASREPAREHPRARVEAIALAARRKAFLASSSLALPPGPLGWMTVLPELVAIWKIQAQMVADIAAVCGRSATLTREQMLYCLFRHAASQAVRDLVMQSGERWLVREATAHAMRRAAERIGIKLSERALGSGIARMLPVAGALGVGAYAWYDTRHVARLAIALFTQDMEFVPTDRGDEKSRTSHADRADGNRAPHAQHDPAQAAREAGL